jgi:hypothetical protein
VTNPNATQITLPNAVIIGLSSATNPCTITFSTGASQVNLVLASLPSNVQAHNVVSAVGSIVYQGTGTAFTTYNIYGIAQTSTTSITFGFSIGTGTSAISGSVGAVSLTFTYLTQ